MRRFKFDYVVVGLVAIAALVLPVRNHNLRAIPEAQTRREQAAAHLFVVQATALPEVNQAVATLAAARQKLVTAQSVLASARQQEIADTVAVRSRIPIETGPPRVAVRDFHRGSRSIGRPTSGRQHGRSS